MENFSIISREDVDFGLRSGPGRSMIRFVKHLCVTFEKCVMAGDLSRNDPRICKRPGNPLLKLFEFIFNSKAHFVRCSCFIQLPIELRIV